MYCTASFWPQGKKILLNQQHWKTSLQLNKLMIPHFPEPTLCQIIWRLGIFNQMKTAGCLGWYSTASPRSSTSTRMGESSGSGTGYRHGCLEACLEYEALEPEKSYNNGSNLAAPSQYFIHLSQAGLVDWGSPHASCRNSPLLRAPQEALCSGCTFFEGKATELSLVASAISWRGMPRSC